MILEVLLVLHFLVVGSAASPMTRTVLGFQLMQLIGVFLNAPSPVNEIMIVK